MRYNGAMSLGLMLQQIDIARGEHKGSRQFCQAMVVMVIVGLVLFGVFAWKTSNYYLAIGEALGIALKPLFDHMSKLSGDNVAILKESSKIISKTPNQDVNQDNLTESIRRQQLSERQRRYE